MIKNGLIFGLPIQVVCATIAIRNEQSTDVSEAIQLATLFFAFLAAPLLSMLYVGILLKLIMTKPHLVTWMRPAGRMSLTVYISESVLAGRHFDIAIRSRAQ